MRLWLIAALLSFCIGVAPARAAEPNFPDRGRSAVVDAAGVIPDAQEAELNARIKKLATHAPPVSLMVNTTKPLINEFMGAIGTSSGDAYRAASGAKNTLETVGRLKSVLDAPGIITGPGAEGRLFLHQLAKVGGFGNKNTDEAIANTRAAIQSMSQLELNAAEQMKGQGAITDRERDLLRKAAGGDISMTKPELRTLANIIDKVARSRIRAYNEQAKKLKKLPGMEQVADLITIDEPGALPVMRFDAQGTLIED